MKRGIIVGACLSALLGAGCPGPGGGGTTTTPDGKGGGSTSKQLKPFDTKNTAKNQAIILGTDAQGGSTTIDLAPGDSKVVVDSMWVRMTTPATGGSSPVTLGTAPQDDETVRVGIFEQFSGGVGMQWRSAVWIGAFLASTMIGKDLIDFKFSAEAGGFVDGPSAGGLFTAGFLAALTGAPVDPTATMTGTVNPDGTIGPVGGIPQKFEGSMGKGKKKLGYPVGLRYSVDVNTGAAVDLHEVAAKGGGVAVEVSDVYGAYELMTGKQLPVPVPLPESAMDLEPEVSKALETHYQGWRKLLMMHWDKIIQINNAGQLPAGLTGMATRAAEEANAAEKALKQGLFATAYHRVINATVLAATATTVWKIVNKVKTGDVAGAKALYVQELNVTDRTANALKKIGEQRPDTIGGHLLMVSAFQSAIAGWGFEVWGYEQMQRTADLFEALEKMTPEQLASPQVAEEVVSKITPPVLALTRGEAMARASLESLVIEDVKTLNYMCSGPRVRRLATSYSSAAAANLSYFESLLVGQVVEALSVTEDKAKQVLAIIEPDYLVSMMSFRMGVPSSGGLVQQLHDEWGENSLPWSLHVLSGSILSYFKSSLLVSKWYSLNVSNDKTTGRPIAVEQEKAFMTMITNAERKSREYAHSAKIAVGEVPVQARLHYQNARVLREGDVADKLKALELFWASSVYSQTAVVMARN